MSRMLLAAMALCLVAGVASAGEDQSWFDMENCAVCANLTKTPGLLESLGWEHYVTDEGMMTVTVVPKGHAKDWMNAKAAMSEAIAQVQKGEDVHLCNFCQSLGGLMANGATMENFDTIGGEVTLVSSTDPATIKAIQAHAERTQKEFKKMEAKGKQSR